MDMEIRNEAMAYVIDLWKKIVDMLEMNDNEATGFVAINNY